MSQELESRIETINGDIRSMQELDEWQSSAQITKERLTDVGLRRGWFYTNNHALNSVEEGEAFLYFGSNDGSIFREETIDEAFKQLRDNKTGNYYRPPVADCEKAKKTSLRLKISDLELKFDSESDSYGYLEIDTSDLTGEKLNETQRKFAEAVYGSMVQDENGESDYGRAMQMLNDGGKGIKTTRIYTLRGETVLKDAKDGDIARACGLGNFNGSSGFNAYNCDVVSNYGLRGVLKSGEAGAQENKVDAIKVNPFADAYQLLTHPENRAEVLSAMTPENVAALSGLITDYLVLQAKK